MGWAAPVAPALSGAKASAGLKPSAGQKSSAAMLITALFKLADPLGLSCRLLCDVQTKRARQISVLGR